LALSLLTACVDWVPLTAEGQRVRVAKAADVVGCTKLGTITARTKVTVGPMARDEAKIAGELEALAKNDAGTMGADTIVSNGPVDWDQRGYDAYRCE
jgi:hypothetical protein